MVAIIGLIMFAVSSYLALSKKMHLMVPFVVVPVVAGLCCGFSLTDVLNFAGTGVQGVFNSVLLCVFAVLYFSVLSETGMFDIMVNRLVSLTKGNIYVVMIVTIIVAFIGHLDGAYNTTYLIAIPALAPLYKKLNIDRRCLVLLVSLAAAPMTAMAWGQPAKMPVYDPNIDPVVMATSLYPVVAIMLAPAILFMGIGIMVGILNGTGMVTAMVDAVLSVVPSSLARYIHIIYAIIILPLEIFIPYQAFQSMNPLLLGIGAGCGLNSYQVLTCLNISYLNPCSPLVAAANLACELAEVDIIKQVKYSVIPCIAFNTIDVLLCVLLGLA